MFSKAVIESMGLFINEYIFSIQGCHLIMDDRMK